MMLVNVLTLQADGGAYPEEVTVSVRVYQVTVVVLVATVGVTVVAVNGRQQKGWGDDKPVGNCGRLLAMGREQSSPGSVVTGGEKTVVLVLIVRVSSSVLVEVTEPREDHPFVTVVVESQVVS